MAQRHTMRSETCAIVGPRPKAFGKNGHNLDYTALYETLRQAMEALSQKGFRNWSTNLSQGIDMIATRAAIDHHDYTDSDAIPVAYIPFSDQAKRWGHRPQEQFGQVTYNTLIKEIWRIFHELSYFEQESRPKPIQYVSPWPTPDRRTYHIANERLITHASALVAVWPRERGPWWEYRGKGSGTVAKLDRALAKSLPVFLIETETRGDAVTPVFADYLLS